MWPAPALQLQDLKSSHMGTPICGFWIWFHTCEKAHSMNISQNKHIIQRKQKHTERLVSTSLAWRQRRHWGSESKAERFLLCRASPESQVGEGVSGQWKQRRRRRALGESGWERGGEQWRSIWWWRRSPLEVVVVWIVVGWWWWREWRREEVEDGCEEWRRKGGYL